MAPSNSPVLNLQNIPYNMLSLIVSKVGATSSVDYVNTILTCKDLNISFEDYFVAKDLNLKLFVVAHANLRTANGGQKEGRFIYGLLLMALGMAEKGKKVLTKLTTEHGLATVEIIWGNVQSSLNGVDLAMKKVYHQSLAKMTPVLNCHPHELNAVCSSCFHHCFLNEFVNLMMGLPENC